MILKISSAILAALLLPGEQATEAPAQVFEKSVKAHLGGKTELEVRDFRIQFSMKLRTQEGKVTFRANHQYRAPDLVKSEVDDDETNIKSTTGFDGSMHWLHKDGKTIRLRGMDFKRDIAEIEERIRLSQIFVKTFSINRFRKDLKNPNRLPDQKTTHGKRILIQATARDFPLLKTAGFPETDLILYFDSETYLLREIFATPIAKGGESRSEKLILGAHREVQGITIPGKIEVYVGKGAKKPTVDIILGQVEFNLDLKKEDFQAPTN